MPIHKTAIVSDQSSIHPSAIVGPYVIIEGEVTIEEDCLIESHAVLKGPLSVGKNTHIHSHAVLGGDPQDRKYNGEKTSLIIGSNNVIREYVTINKGTIQGNSQTSVGNDNLIMAYSHIAHDCSIGNECVLANGTTLAGHVCISDQVVIGGLCAIHQHVKIGRLAMIAGGAMVSQDVPPFMLAQGDRAVIRGINRVGLRRDNINNEQIKHLNEVFKYFARHSSKKERIEYISNMPSNSLSHEIMKFLKESTRGLCKCKSLTG
jgi:UDP-N-acetylglucosamine acyltransferase